MPTSKTTNAPEEPRIFACSVLAGGAGKTQDVINLAVEAPDEGTP